MVPTVFSDKSKVLLKEIEDLQRGYSVPFPASSRSTVSEDRKLVARELRLASLPEEEADKLRYCDALREKTDLLLERVTRLQKVASSDMIDFEKLVAALLTFLSSSEILTIRRKFYNRGFVFASSHSEDQLMSGVFHERCRQYSSPRVIDLMKTAKHMKASYADNEVSGFILGFEDLACDLNASGSGVLRGILRNVQQTNPDLTRKAVNGRKSSRLEFMRLLCKALCTAMDEGAFDHTKLSKCTKLTTETNFVRMFDVSSATNSSSKKPDPHPLTESEKVRTFHSNRPFLHSLHALTLLCARPRL